MKIKIADAEDVVVVVPPLPNTYIPINPLIPNDVTIHTYPYTYIRTYIQTSYIHT